MNHASTYILTAELDAENFSWLDDLRRKHFPPERNLLCAHLTMFHQLSPLHIERLAGVSLPSSPIKIAFSGITFLGFGSAVSIASDELEQLRQKLKDTMGDGLSRQDTQRWSPHVTIQNKAPPETARDLLKMLDSQFTPRVGETLGLQIWEYLGGPWRQISRLRFAASE